MTERKASRRNSENGEVKPIGVMPNWDPMRHESCGVRHEAVHYANI